MFHLPKTYTNNITISNLKIKSYKFTGKYLHQINCSLIYN